MSIASLFAFSLSLLRFPVSLMRLSIFPLVSSMFVVAHWSIFKITALKSLSNNSNTSVFMVLASTDYLLSVSLRAFLIPRHEWFWVENWTFSHYVIETLDLIDTFCFIWLFLTPLQWGMWDTLCYHMEVEVWVYNLASKAGILGSSLLIGSLLGLVRL